MSDTTKQAPSPADVASLARQRPIPTAPVARRSRPTPRPRGGPRRRGHRCPGARPLARGGRRRHGLRHPRRRDPARPTTRCSTPRRSATSSCVTSRAPATPPRGMPRRRARGRVHGDLGAGCDQPRHADRGRPHGLRAHGRHHRAGRERLHRHRRLPGGRHPRHHDADHEAQLPRHRPGQDPAGHRRGLPRRQHRPTRPRPRRHQQGRPAGDDDLQLAAADRPARLPPGDPAAQQADPRGEPPHVGGEAAGALRRWRCRAGPGERAAPRSSST